MVRNDYLKERDNLDIYGFLTQELKGEIENRKEIQVKKSPGNLELIFNDHWNPSDFACNGLIQSYLQKNEKFRNMLGTVPKEQFVNILFQQFYIESENIKFKRYHPGLGWSGKPHTGYDKPNEEDYSEYQMFVNAIIWAYIRRHDVIKENSMKDISFGIEKFQNG